ncbi:HAD family phosphatase [Candidatus Saccharibacteria bacterium]|nr:HAD family phosphatase [Candidatus Saccharibacteria bacterium]
MTRQPIDTIFFDWGGVIADDPGDDFLLGLLRRLGCTETQAKEVYDNHLRSFIRGEITEADFWQLLRNSYGLVVHETVSEDFKQWRGLIQNNDILQLVHAARSQGIGVALLTNVIEPTYNVLLAEGCYEPFDDVVASCKVGYAKPQPEIYQLALGRMHTSAERSLFIDDKPRNIEAATSLGFHTILAQTPTQIVQDVREHIY